MSAGTVLLLVAALAVLAAIVTAVLSLRQTTGLLQSLVLACADLASAAQSETVTVIPPESPRDRLLTDRLRDRFLVTVDGGETFSGLLLEVDDRALVLGDVKLVQEQQAPTDVQGELVLERTRVLYLQRP
jgi:hypothetical protein